MTDSSTNEKKNIHISRIFSPVTSPVTALLNLRPMWIRSCVYTDWMSLFSSHRTSLLLTNKHWSLILLRIWPMMLFDLMNNLARITGALMWQMHFWRRAVKAQSREGGGGGGGGDESMQALLSPLLCTLSLANRQEINLLWLIRTASGNSSAYLCPVASDTQVIYIAFKLKD